MNAWAKLVQKTYNANKHKAGYKLKNAMKDSKKLYKTMKRRGGDPDLNEATSVVADAAAPEVAVGGKNKSKKSHNKSAKKSRKNRK
jgi:hypothetical protein